LAWIDVGPLRRSRDLRWLFIGQSVSGAGSMLTFVAIPYQAYRITHSSLIVGLLSLAELGPLLLVAFIGGVLADAVDRRRMVRWTEFGLCVATAGLVLNAALPPARLWVLFVIAALTAGLGGLQRPSLSALVPRLVQPEELAAAAAANSAGSTFGQVLGPPVAGVLLATVGLALTYGVNVATFVFSLFALAQLTASPPPPNSAGLSLAAVRQGIRYAGSRQELLGTYLVDIGAMVFGMPTALFPQVASRQGGAAVLGVLYASPAMGALLLSLTSGWTARIRRYGRAVAIAAAIWGVGIIGFGLAESLPLAVVALIVAGAADEASAIFRSTMWNLTIPDTLRGRLAGIEMLSYSSGPAVGNAEAGLVEALFGLRTSIVSGGVLCVAACVGLSLALPRFWRYHADPSDLPVEP
jgi:MFS family permease